VDSNTPPESPLYSPAHARMIENAQSDLDAVGAVQLTTQTDIVLADRLDHPLILFYGNMYALPRETTFIRYFNSRKPLPVTFTCKDILSLLPRYPSPNLKKFSPGRILNCEEETVIVLESIVRKPTLGSPDHSKMESGDLPNPESGNLKTPPSSKSETKFPWAPKKRKLQRTTSHCGYDTSAPSSDSEA